MLAFDPIVACATCEATSTLVGGEAAKWSILFLLAITLGILCGVGYFMWRMAVREREHLEPELSDDFIPESSR
jgi:hypothetical protein